jgi:hypothetical protein
MSIKKIVSPNKSLKRIYLVIYDQQEFYGYDANTPVKAFKTKKIAELYASTRNFEFQTVCMLDDEDYENYVLLNSFADYIVSISDLRDASGFVREEVSRMDRNKVPINLWKILSNINPFKVVPIEYIIDSIDL